MVMKWAHINPQASGSQHVIDDVDVVQNVFRGVNEEAGDHQVESIEVVVAVGGAVDRFESSELNSQSVKERRQSSTVLIAMLVTTTVCITPAVEYLVQGSRI